MVARSPAYKEQPVMSNHLNTSVLFIVFNRPETTRQVFEAIRQARPPRLYIAADGPRDDRPDEKELCEKVRKIATTVDWPCEVSRLFHDKNLGVKFGGSTAIDWFFQHEPEGIILEDDVVPVRSFFPFCAELLERYRDDTRISMIGGTNFQVGIRRGDASYYFSRMHHIWGWASWRRAWQKYDRDMALWEPFKRDGGFAQLGLTGPFEKSFAPHFDAVATGKLEAWDYQWVFSCLAQNSCAVIPNVNMVTNIGFGADASHTKDTETWLSRMETVEMDFPLRHPEFFAARWDADLFTIKKSRPSMTLKRVLNAVARRLR